MWETAASFGPKVWAYMKALFSMPERVKVLERLLPAANFDAAAALLNGTHFDRVRGTMQLDKLAREHPAELHVKVMEMFSAFLAYPPTYGQKHPKAGRVDPYSQDIAWVMRAITSRTPEQLLAEEEAGYSFRLSANSPFEYRDGCFYFGDEKLTEKAIAAEAQS